MEVRWSACSPSTPTIRVRIQLKSTFFCKIVVEKNKNKQKDPGVGPFKTNVQYSGSFLLRGKCELTCLKSHKSFYC